MSHARNRVSYLFILLLCLAGPALAWLGALDRVSEASIDRSLLATGAAYATIRGINALVSVMQGTEVHAVMLTIAAGEVLDPINDLVERLSTLMLYALGSLALQKLLLTLVAERLFNVFLTLLAGIAVLGLLRPRSRLATFGLRLYLVTLLLRFALALSALASGWVDESFLAEREARQREAMEAFRGELAALESAPGGDPEQGWLARLRSSVSPDELRARFAALEHRVDDFAASAMSLAMSLLLKGMLLPLLFLFALATATRAGLRYLAGDLVASRTGAVRR
jgi:hypothetical protein